MSTLLLSAFGIIGIILCISFCIAGFPRIICSVFSLFRLRKEKEADTEHAYGVLICARNESAVIARLINSLDNQDYPADKLRIFVMADNCTDNTAELARQAGATVFERHDDQRVGKGYALEELIRTLADDQFARGCKGFVCFDADNIVDPGFIREINKAVCNGAELAKGYRCSSNPGDGFIAGSHALCFICECSTLDRGRKTLGINSFITGTGFYVSRQILEEEGGWHYFTLSEDSELTVDQFIKGRQTVFCHDAIFYDEQPNTMAVSLRQRKRWLRGTLQVFCKYGKALTGQLFSSRFLSSYDQLAQLFQSVYLTAPGFIAAILSIAVTFFVQGWVAGLWSLGIYFGTLYGIFFAMGLFAAVLGRKRLPLSLPSLLFLLIRFPFYMMTFLPLSVYVLFHKNIAWDEIKHGSGSVTLLNEKNEL